MPTRLVSPCGSYSCWIELDGRKELEIYKTRGDAKNASGFLASAPGFKYSINFEARKADTRSYHPEFVCKYYVDGNACGTSITDPSSVATPHISWTAKRGVTEGDLHRRFMFSRVELAEDGYAPPENQVKELASIKITVVRARYGMKGYAAEQDKYTAVNLGPIAEKSVKATVGCLTGYDTPQFARQLKVNGTIFHPSDSHDTAPLYTFVLRHAPLDMLQAQGIAPAPAQAEEAPPEEIDEESEYDEAEVAREAEELRARLSELDRIQNKRKRSEGTDIKPDIKPSVTSGPSAKKAKVVPKVEGAADIVDLTDLDD